ncbi:MAG TPA: dihydrodipicolinate synthase family protein [Pseudolabrys sp.]|jgi:dihydrodipicolinate synthase/N-acetylneuraminate lyase|nr:dihydrodipicolinate synthase family protein [Pseudolabrys sp.]
MKTTPVTPADLAASVLSVPPLARNANFAIDKAENVKLLNHLRGGGVRTFMYGGNANLYNIGVSELRTLAEMLVEIARDDDWVIPSVGSDFGKAMDQVAVMRDLPFPTVMLLPHKAQSTPAGVATGIRKLADAYGKPVIAYVKDEGYVEAADMGKLVKDGAVCAIKYAIVRDNPKDDAFLSELVNCVDRSKIISGIGERPAIDHLTKFGLQAFTSGSVCVAPGLSMALLRAIKRNDLKDAERIRALFIPLEDQRDKHSPLRVLHDAVRLAGISNTGPMQPYLTGFTDPAILGAIEKAAKELLAAERSATAKAA